MIEDRGAAGFVLSNEDAARSRSPAQQQQRKQRRQRAFFAAALSALLVALSLFALSSSSSQQRPLSRPLPPPPSASCAPADASTRLEFFRGRLGGFSFPTATASNDAQALIDQGWLLYCGFHRSAAAAAFSAALELEPGSSGAALGLSWSLGPGANLVDGSVPWPAFEAERDFPAAAEAAAKALGLAEERERKSEEEDDGGGDGVDNRSRLRFLAKRDLALARIAAARFAPGTASEGARKRAEAEAAAKMEEAARSLKASSSSSLPSADPALLALAAELKIHEAQWDYWELPPGQENADSGGGAETAADDGTGRPPASRSRSSFLKMKPHAASAAALVREVLRIDPLEPLALHLAVHLSEAAPPEQAATLGLAAADALSGIVRGEEEEEEAFQRQALLAAAAAASDGTALLLPPSPKTKQEAAKAPWISAGIPHLLHMPVSFAESPICGF